jgi:hypothetical protein
VPQSLKQFVESGYTEGKNCYSTFRRVYPFTAVAGTWCDLSMAPGGPPANYYIGSELMATIPLVTAGVQGWYRKGIWHGEAVSPDKKYLHKVAMFSSGAGGAPATYLLCDYLMYYPLIDMDSVAEQMLINYGPTVTLVTDPAAAVLPRYTDGIGVKAFLVASNPYLGGQMFQIKYTNTLNQANRYSKMTVSNLSTNIGTIVNSYTAGVQQYGPFIELQTGDVGIKSIQSIQFVAGNGGLAVLVLVKPIATLMLKGIDAWGEVDFIKDKASLPRIYDDAYLNLLVMAGATLAAVTITGEITTVWGG